MRVVHNEDSAGETACGVDWQSDCEELPDAFQMRGRLNNATALTDTGSNVDAEGEGDSSALTISALFYH